MIRNKLGVLVPDTPVMRDLVPRLPNETPISSLKDSRILPLRKVIPEVGDMLFWDKILKELCIVRADKVAEVIPTYLRKDYETNGDTYVGTLDGVMHFCAKDDAVANNPLYSDDVAATACFYRIEIDNTIDGSITFSATSGNGSIASTTLNWTAGATMESIVAQFTALNNTGAYITFGALADGKGVGLEIGGYGANTLTATATTGCTVIDCSGLAMLASANEGIAVGDDYDPTKTYAYIGQGIHHNFRGVDARTILGSVCKGANTTCIANDGFNYSYRTGINFAKSKAWATTGGENTFYDDGEGESIANPGAHVMNETTFNTGVRDYTGEDEAHLKMKAYYTHLLTDESGDYADLRAEYEEKYGAMSTMYDAYLMSHCIDPAALTGITADLRNYGMTQTTAKADCLNVSYNYKFIPAYPPEYDAQQYGMENGEYFKKGAYYHPEPADNGLMFRDDIMPKINANIDTTGGVKLTNSTYRGSCADFSASNSWYFFGGNGYFSNLSRYYGLFRSRPFLALSL